MIKLIVRLALSLCIVASMTLTSVPVFANAEYGVVNLDQEPRIIMVSEDEKIIEFDVQDPRGRIFPGVLTANVTRQPSGAARVTFHNRSGLPIHFFGTVSLFGDRSNPVAVKKVDEVMLPLRSLTLRDINPIGGSYSGGTISLTVDGTLRPPAFF